MNKYLPKVDLNDVWSNIELYSDISQDVVKKVENRLDYV
jgi:hypothetical protein